MARRALVIGGTGLLGEPVARGLQDAGFVVRIMTRDASRARVTFAPPFEIAEGDAQQRAALESALGGCKAVHLSIDHEREDECVARVVEVGRGLGLERIAYISGTTVCEENRWFPLVDRKWKAEQVIRASDIDYTILRPGWFMEMLARFLRDGRAVVFGRPTQHWHFVALEDFARMVVAAYRNREAVGKSLYVHGPEALTVTEALQAYCDALHPEIDAVRSIPYWAARLLARLRQNDKMRAGIEMVAYLERVGERGDGTQANAVLGPPQVTLAAWLQKQVETAPVSAVPGMRS